MATLQTKIETTQRKIKDVQERLIPYHTKRYDKAVASNSWESEYIKRDIERYYKEIENLQKTLTRLYDQETMAKEKDASRGDKVEIIVQYLENWKQQVTLWYQQRFTDFNNTAWLEKKEIHKLSEIAEDYRKEHKLGYMTAMATDSYKAYNKARNEYEQKWKDIVPYLIQTTYNKEKEFYNNEFDKEKLEKELSKEVVRKYNDLIDRVTHITGKITDASNIKIGGQTGEINGYIVGERGKAEVSTISASGPVQCFHYRVLIKEVK